MKNILDINTFLVFAALVIALAVAALFVSLFAIYRTLRVGHRASGMVEEAREEFARSAQAFDSRLTSLAAKFENSPRSHAAEPLPGAPRSCMNLSRRSQALRLHRRGESPAQIARALDLPRQEVDLLLKVHEIVLTSSAIRMA